MSLIAALPRPRVRTLVLTLRPAHLAALTVLLVCVPTGDKDVTAAVHITPADLGSLALVGVVGIAAVRELRAGGGGLLRLRHGLLFGGVLAAVAASTAASQDPHQSLSGFVRLVQIFVVVPLAVLLALREERDRVLVLRAFVAAAVIEGAVGAWQFATLTGASYEGVTQRAVGTFGVQDVMAMSVVVSYGLLAATALALRARAAGRGRLALGYGLTGGFLVVPLAVSFSRGSWIATGVALAVMLVAADLRLALRGLVFGLAAALVLVGGFGVGGQAVLARVASIGSVSSAPDHSVSDRYDLWTTARRIWQDHPATGVGPKEFPSYRDAHAPLRLSSGSDTMGAGAAFAKEPLLSPHNMYLLLLSEDGLLGLAAFAALFLGLLTQTASSTRRRPDRHPAPGSAGTGAAPQGAVSGSAGTGVAGGLVARSGPGGSDAGSARSGTGLRVGRRPDRHQAPGSAGTGATPQGAVTGFAGTGVADGEVARSGPGGSDAGSARSGAGLRVGVGAGVLRGSGTGSAGTGVADGEVARFGQGGSDAGFARSGAGPEAGEGAGVLQGPGTAFGGPEVGAGRSNYRVVGLGLAAGGLLVWQLVDFLYADIGGTTTVLISLVLGLAAATGREEGTAWR